MKTYCAAEMAFIDVDALDDSTLSSSDGQGFDDLSLFKNEEMAATTDYASLDHNLFVLNESKTIPDAPKNVGFMSTAQSSENCEFTTAPKLTITFTDNHTSAGITLYFANYYPAELKITWYSLSGVKLTSKAFEPDSLVYTCVEQVVNYGKVEIEFTKTCFPKQSVWLQYIMWGKYISWEGDIIQKAKVTEELDVTSATLSINESSVAILDASNDFDISNADGAWNSVQKTQPVTLTEYMDEKAVPMGTFYISKYSFSKNVATFNLIDAVGLLDNFTFYDGTIYENVTVSSIVASIMAVCPHIKYSITDELKDITLSGYLGIKTCRAALQLVAFAIGAVVDDSRSNVISIYKPDRYIKYTIGTDRKFNGNTKVAQDSYISGVSIECSKYSLASESNKIYDDTLQAGSNRIEFNGPYKADTITATAGTITEVHTNYLVITMTEEGACTITGTPYEESKFTMAYNTDSIEAGEYETVKKYTGCTLYNPNTINDVLQAIFRYYKLRKTLSMKYLLNYEHAGQWVNVKDVDDHNNATMIEKQSIDLTGGFIADATCRGYVLNASNMAYYFTGIDICTNTGIGGYIL